MTSDEGLNAGGQHADLLACFECRDCGWSGDEALGGCPDCGSHQVGEPKEDVGLPPCWKEDAAVAIATDVDRLWVHLDGPGFIGMEGGEVELVRADISRGEEPDPEVRPATAENVRELAEKYNDEAYGDANEHIGGADVAQ